MRDALITELERIVSASLSDQSLRKGLRDACAQARAYNALRERVLGLAGELDVEAARRIREAVEVGR